MGGSDDDGAGGGAREAGIERAVAGLVGLVAGAAARPGATSVEDFLGSCRAAAERVTGGGRDASATPLMVFSAVGPRPEGGGGDGDDGQMVGVDGVVGGSLSLWRGLRVTQGVLRSLADAVLENVDQVEGESERHGYRLFAAMLLDWSGHCGVLADALGGEDGA